MVRDFQKSVFSCYFSVKYKCLEGSIIIQGKQNRTIFWSLIIAFYFQGKLFFVEKRKPKIFLFKNVMYRAIIRNRLTLVICVKFHQWPTTDSFGGSMSPVSLNPDPILNPQNLFFHPSFFKLNSTDFRRLNQMPYLTILVD